MTFNVEYSIIFTNDVYIFKQHEFKRTGCRNVHGYINSGGTAKLKLE